MRKEEADVYKFTELPSHARVRAMKDLRAAYGIRVVYDVPEILLKAGEMLHVRLEHSVERGLSYGRVLFGPEFWTDGRMSLSGNRARAFLWNHFGSLIEGPKVYYWSRRGGRLHEEVAVWSRRRESRCLRENVLSGRYVPPVTGTDMDERFVEPMALFCLGLRRDSGGGLARSGRDAEEDSLTTASGVVKECAHALFSALDGDALSTSLTEERFAAKCESAGFEFTEDGALFTGARKGGNV